MPPAMKIRKFVTVTLLVLSSFAANSVAPSKTELEAMYDKAFREFDSSNYEQALKDLDAIDARQPDLAESQNLRGVILMRQKDYANAEVALRKALAADPKFWNARFNLAEVPFLQKNWPEARKRFQELLNGKASELQAEATQLIQYKILLTHLMEGKENMVTALIGKFELSPDTPAVHYANAALALNKKDEAEAKKWLTTSEKTFSPQLNKLFAESLYEIGFLEKPAGQTRAALELNSQAERAAQTKAFAQAKFEEAELALQQRDFTAARKFVDEANAADPNQAPILNLRGEILLEQKEFDQAENEFRNAVKVDPKFRDAQYNLAQVPFKKKEYTVARDRFEALFATTNGTDKDRAAQLIKFKIYLTLLLEGKDSRAQKMMEQFQFTGDTPALYYAQAAWEFKHNNPTKANDWVTSARKIYPPALNGVFADSFFDLGWLQIPTPGTSPAPALADAGSAEPAPSIEPTPLPAISLAKNDQPKASDPLTLAAPANSVVPGMEATTSSAAGSPAASIALTASSSPSVETPVASTASPAAARAVPANPSDADPTTTEAPVTASSVPPLVAATSASPATVLAPAKVREWSQPNLLERLESVGGRNTLLVGVLLLVAAVLIGWALIPELRRRFSRASANRGGAPVSVSSYEEEESVGAVQQLVAPTRLAGGPPQVSLQLRASEPALRRAVMPSGKSGRPPAVGYGTSEGGNPTGHAPTPAAVAVATPVETEEVQSEPVAAAPAESFEEAVYEPIAAAFEEPAPATEFAEPPAPVQAETPQLEQLAPEPISAMATIAPVESWEPMAAEISASTAEEPEIVSAVEEEAPMPMAAELPASVVADEPAAPPVEFSQPDSEPVGQGQPVPFLTPAPIAESAELEPPAKKGFFASLAAATSGLAGIGALRHSVDNPSVDSNTVTTEPTAQQPTTPAIMTQPTPAPVIRTAPPSAPTAQTGAAPQSTGALQPTAPQGGGGMHTAVQLTFSFEIASLQLTPSFKMGALQLKPTSKIVTMRLAPSQQPQPAMNLQVTFEIATVQLAGNSLGMVRLTPSQQQRPSVISSPSFNIAGLQLVSGADAAPVQLTPSQQGQASVHVTAGFQIATVEFSPSFEIASIILNSTSRNVSVQLPGAGPSAVEGAPVFEIGNVQLTGNGEIGMMQLNPQGSTPKRA